jgi:hypothetical protein
MKKTIILITLLIALLLGSIVLFVGYGFIIGPSLDGESATLSQNAKSWIDTNIPQIITNWSKDSFLNSASSKLISTIKDTDIDKMLSDSKSSLGSMVRYNGSAGKIVISVNPLNKTIIGTYTVNADFQKGSANFLIDLIQENGTWKIFNFHIDIKNSSQH